MHAFRMHQIDTLEARTAFFEKKLERIGVKVPRASVLITEGFNAPLQAVRSQSMAPAQTRPLEAMTTTASAMQEIGEQSSESEGETAQ